LRQPGERPGRCGRHCAHRLHLAPLTGMRALLPSWLVRHNRAVRVRQGGRGRVVCARHGNEQDPGG
jgi:hypothetical protein